MSNLLDQKTKRIQVVGSSCVGKTTFSKKLSEILNIPHVELDFLHWEPNWKEADVEVFKSRISKAIVSDAWIVDGQYSGKIGSLVSKEINIIIWLDMSLFIILKRFFIRTLKRSWTREILWNGCQETLKNSVFKRNSLLMWILNTHRARRAKYLCKFKTPSEGITYIRLQSPKEVVNFLDNVQSSKF